MNVINEIISKEIHGMLNNNSLREIIIEVNEDKSITIKPYYLYRTLEEKQNGK